LPVSDTSLLAQAAIRDSRIALRSLRILGSALPARLRPADSSRTEDRLIADTVAKFNWDPKIPFDQFDARSINNARNARESQVYRDQFLASIKDRLDTAAVKGQALDLCQELFLADGAQSYEEDDALQNLKTLLA
jgi:hypothetical protein